MQSLNCSLCNQKIPGALNGLSRHLVNDHGLSLKRGMGDSGFRCGQNGCQSRFYHFYTLRDHINKHHLNNNYDNDYQDDEEPLIPDDNDDNVMNFDLRKYVIQMVAKFQCKPSMTTSLLVELLDECEQLLFHTRDYLKQKVEQFFNTRQLHDDEAKDVLKAFAFDSPFDGLKTLNGQIELLKQHCHYIEPIEVPLGYRIDSILDKSTGTYMPKQVLETCQYVPVIPTLTLVMSSPEIRKAVESEKKSPDDILASFVDGEYFEIHPLFSRYPHALRLQIYYDELETVNPLGSKTGVHKLGIFYYTIQNLPPQINSELSSIHVLVMCSDADAKKYGFKKILAPFFEELRHLESDDGISIETTEGEFVLRASIAAFCGDGLAVHDVFNFLAPSANHFCRMCMYSRNDLHSGSLELGQKRSKELYDQHITFLRQNNFSAESKSETGLRGECCLHESRYFHVSDNKVFDVMHDLLCGICPMIIKLVLNEYILVQKKFNCAYFNGKIMSFQYGFIEMTNKPSANFTDGMLRKSEHTLSQKAMQIWCLIRAFPFLVADKIPLGDKHMALILNLLKIMEIIFAPKINSRYLRSLQNLITNFHTNFLILFPNVNPINKFHHMGHYVECIRWMGPLINRWCMRYEAKHGGIRLRAQNVHNFKNLPKTLIRLCQCSQSAKWGAADVKINRFMASNGDIVAVEDTASRESLHSLDYIDTDEVFRCNSVKVNGVDFRVGLYVCLETSITREDNLCLFGCIQEIIVLRNSDVHFLVSVCITTEFDTNLNAYHIESNDNDDDPGLFIETCKLPYFKPFCCWTKPESNDLYISLRHILL
ncbi:uncharacterized protein LOC130670103 isoform X2 [Microplitis mediator]|uniref:uncharacterized protein LOC130666477 isoform X2 n=1 Tax=Microplitis mediator TaxID=375433 RepID=UPI002555BD72|nr:uncharacterized protein LOC130666477 isoform X2 [Microplitis mediator]XP_057329288.1 uncharacterized protein LOC130670103 isoform X2 [Microplitis mediator]